MMEILLTVFAIAWLALTLVAATAPPVISAPLVPDAESESESESAEAAAARPPQPLAWTRLGPGIESALIPINPNDALGFESHAFRVSLAHYTPQIAEARATQGRDRAPVERLMADAGAHLAINGTFFDRSWRPLGLLVSQRRVLNALRRADWGVLSVTGGRASLVHTRAFTTRDAERVDFAIQVGPRVVVDGKATGLKRQFARRSALGIMADGVTLVVVITDSIAESNDFAALMARSAAEGGLGARQALMLDGGPSAQLSMALGGQSQVFPGIYGVPNAVVFVPR